MNQCRICGYEAVVGYRARIYNTYVCYDCIETLVGILIEHNPNKQTKNIPTVLQNITKELQNNV